MGKWHYRVRRSTFFLITCRVVILLCPLLLMTGCSTVDVVRLQPDVIDVPQGMEPIAGLQASCIGFYLFTLGIPDVDLEKAVNELLVEKARKIGGERVANLQFDATPEGGIWWLLKLFGFRTAYASGIVIKPAPYVEDEVNDSDEPPPLRIPTPVE